MYFSMRNYKKLECLQKIIGKNLKQDCFFPKFIENSTIHETQSVTIFHHFTANFLPLRM
jgi:hypothetical protein